MIRGQFSVQSEFWVNKAVTQKSPVSKNEKKERKKEQKGNLRLGDLKVGLD